MSETIQESGSWRRQSIVDEASLWLAMCSDPHTTDADRAAFVDWLRRSNLHVEEFLRLSAMTKRLSGSPTWPPDSVEELVARAQQSSEMPRIGRTGGEAEGRGAEPERRGAESERRGAEPQRRGAEPERQGAERARQPFTLPSELFRAGSKLRYAAVVAVALAALAGLAAALRPLLLERDGTTYTTSIGEMRSIVLVDGSVVELNTRSRLHARIGERVRLVELEAGEAIFKVAKDAARPFHVMVGDTEIAAVGTQFNVYAEQARTVVTVLEGRVRVTDRATPAARRPGAAGGAEMGAEVELASGEQAVVTPRKPIARVALADPTRVTSWTERRLIFEDTTLAGVAAQFARYSPRLIRIDDAALAARQISGVFDASDPASLVEFLGAQGGVTIERTQEGWTLR